MEFRCIRQQRAIKTILTQPDAGKAFVYRVGVVNIGRAWIDDNIIISPADYLQ